MYFKFTLFITTLSVTNLNSYYFKSLQKYFNASEGGSWNGVTFILFRTWNLTEPVRIFLTNSANPVQCSFSVQTLMQRNKIDLKSYYFMASFLDALP